MCRVPSGRLESRLQAQSPPQSLPHAEGGWRGATKQVDRRGWVVALSALGLSISAGTSLHLSGAVPVPPAILISGAAIPGWSRLSGGLLPVSAESHPPAESRLQAESCPTLRGWY